MGAGDYLNERRDEEISNSVGQDLPKWIAPFAAGIGAITLGSFLLKKRIADSSMSGIFNILGFPRGVSLASDAAANIGKSEARSSTAGIRSMLNATYDVSRNKLNLGPIDLIDDLRNSVELLGNTNLDKSIADHIKERTIEYVNRELVTGGNNTGFFTQGLQRVTFGQILEDQAAWSKVLSPNQMGVIQKATQFGLVSKSQIVDKKLFYNTSTKEVLDFRLRNIFTKVSKVDTPAGAVYQRSFKFDIFNQAEIISSLFSARRNIAVVGPEAGGTGSRVFIGGNVYGYARDAAGNYTPQLIGTDRILRKSLPNIEVIEASRRGKLEINLPVRKGFFGSIMGWMESNLGIGRAFGTRPTPIERFVVNPIQRFNALRKGEGVIYRGPYHKSGSSKVMDFAFGAENPDLYVRGGILQSVEGRHGVFGIEELSGVGISTAGIPRRSAVFFDLLDGYNIVKAKSVERLEKGIQSSLTSADFVVRPRTGSYRITGTQIPSNNMANSLSDIIRDDMTAGGFKASSNRYAYHDVQKAKFFGKSSAFFTGIRDFVSYSTWRVANLASESLLGLSIKPSHNPIANMARLGLIPVAYETGRQAIMYADYLSEEITGVSPLKALGSVYAGLRLAQQKARELTGIQQASSFLDTYFPGSINSEGSVIARSILAPLGIASLFLGRGRFMGAAAGAAATYAAIGGPEPGQTSEDLYREYIGDKKVPVRKGAFWGMGYLPFFGGKPDYYDYSWYAKLTSDYKDKSIYGSKDEYWRYHANVFGIPLPTPSNLFGVLNVLNPYRLEEINYNERPYPQTSHPISNFPIIGPLLGATVGELLKPTKYREPDQLPLLKAGLADKGITANTARMLGLSSMEATSYEAEDPSSITNLVMRQANIASEPLGLYKFAMEFFGVSTKPDIGTEYATSSMISDPGRTLYDLGVGGALGQTEFIRRFFLADYSSQYRRAAAINPIRNSMPTWLPGAYSEVASDRSYFMDFTMGDPYIKLVNGEARLPGRGYEALNDLYSGKEGEYSDVDKFLILADVAPYSTAYKQYERKVLALDLDERWSTKVQEAIEQRKKVLGVDDRYKRYEEDIIAMNLNTLVGGIYAPLRKAYDFLTHDVLAEIPYFGSKLFPFRSPYEQYRKLHVEGAEYASWNEPWEGVLRPIAYDIALEDPITAAGKGAALGALLSGPMRWFNPIKSYVGDLGRTVSASAIQHGAIAAAGLSAARIAAGYGEDMMPFHMRQEEAAIDYMDKIAYIKGRMIESAGGGPQYADRTFVGARSMKGYRSALPTSSDRRYFDYFSNLEEDQRTQIIGGLPSYMAVGLDRFANQDFNTRDEADEEVSIFLKNNLVPDQDWIGWHPQVSAAATKLKFVQDGINGIASNIHRYGFFEGHEVDLKTRLSEFNEQSINFVQSPMHGSFDDYIRGNTKVLRKSTPYRSSREITMYKERDQELINAIRFR